MTPEQALQLLDQAASLATLSRNDHAKIQEAVKILRDLIKPKEVKEEK